MTATRPMGANRKRHVLGAFDKMCGIAGRRFLFPSLPLPPPARTFVSPQLPRAFALTIHWEKEATATQATYKGVNNFYYL